MEIQVNKYPDAYVVHLSGRWDAYSTTSFESTCKELIDDGMTHMILNLNDVDYISSLGLRGLLNIGKALDPLGGAVVICGLRPQLRKIFVGSGFSSLFADYPDIQSARSAIQR